MMFRSQQTAAICVNTDSAAAMAIFKQQCVANDHDFATQAQNGVWHSVNDIPWFQTVEPEKETPTF